MNLSPRSTIFFLMKTINVSHILVKSEFEAQDVLKLLKEGKKFEDLAQKFSTCPSASQGGLLGTVPLQRLDEDFADAAVLLKAGETSAKPVRTRFGYHIIRREA